MNPENLKSGDNVDLEALFDEIAEQRVWDDSPVEAPAPVAQVTAASAEPESGVSFNETPLNEEPHDVFRRVGSLTRKLHDALRELGYDKSVESAVNSLPDARARLNYIAELTGKAADKVLGAVEASQKLNDDMAARAAELDRQWDRLYNHEMSLEEFKSHARENREFMKEIAGNSSQMGGHLTDIMMAQDFHDLTGQVVNRIGNMAQGLEEQLVQLLLDTTPPDQRKQVEETFLNGPAINAEGRADVCSNQSQVDDLLESLGF
ncbi:chemotaxis phosphatase CheZ [Limnobacter thiooxidans]|uniref:Protein phosphatase CheZ n=1 Tax=Limnobacter thiooxidans TaxID=131080 RepID=A0AA86M8A6_9BURK|nr:chemotaxis phosphatase CheZ [Limnobacter thiooxidans]BET25544.1 protein phosphatase CheZ [Limnobacter thiooxidans]